MTSGTQINLFVASAGDCSELREIAEEVVSEVNDLLKFEGVSIRPFFWEKDMVPDANDDFQEAIFETATKVWGGGECDVLLVLTWYKKGHFTVIEFETYIGEIAGRKDARLFFLKYAKPIPIHPMSEQLLEDISSLPALYRWYEDIRSRYSISELGRAEGNIQEDKDFKKEFHTELTRFAISKRV